jgi:hypothetical protein
VLGTEEQCKVKMKVEGLKGRRGREERRKGEEGECRIGE